MNTLEAIRRRQSCRSYKAEQLTDAEITTILQAANASPVGMGQYEDVKLTVIQNQEILTKIDKLTAELVNRPDAHPIYGAPTIILVSGARKEGHQGSVAYCNAACIIENMALAATDLGIGNVYLMGTAFAISMKKELCRDLKIPEGFFPISAIALGRSATEPQVREFTTDRIATDFIL